MLLIISIIALVLLVWFRTDAWLEYCRLLQLDFISFYSDFLEKQASDISLTYHIYLRRYHNCFFVRLITCPICLAFWLAVIMLGIRALFFVLLLIVLHQLSIFMLLVILFKTLKLLPFVILGGITIFAAIERLLG